MKNLGVDIIYILNRKKDFERREAVVRELSNIEGLNYQIITAVTGDSLRSIPNLIKDKKLFPIFYIDKTYIIVFIYNFYK